LDVRGQIALEETAALLTEMTVAAKSSEDMTALAMKRD
jgi:hypothetical protein